MRGKGFVFTLLFLAGMALANAGFASPPDPLNELSLMMSEKIKVVCLREYEWNVIEYSDWNVVLGCDSPSLPGTMPPYASVAPVNVLSLQPGEVINIDCQDGGEWLILESTAFDVLIECHFYTELGVTRR